MSAISRPTNASQMKTDSTNSQSPGNILKDNTSGIGSIASNSKTKPKVFDENGAVGGAFTETGAVGGTAQSIGGPLAQDGIIGRQFTTEGAIGGTVQNALGGEKKV